MKARKRRETKGEKEEEGRASLFFLRSFPPPPSPSSPLRAYVCACLRVLFRFEFPSLHLTHSLFHCRRSQRGYSLPSFFVSALVPCLLICLSSSGSSTNFLFRGSFIVAFPLISSHPTSHVHHSHHQIYSLPLDVGGASSLCLCLCFI